MKNNQVVFTFATLLLFAAFSAAQSDKPATTKPNPKTQKVENMMDSFQLMEKGLWQAWKDRDVKPFEQHLTQDAIMIDNSGLADRATALKGITGCDVKNYSLGDFKLTPVDADAALLTYKATGVDATCEGGMKVPESILASTLFKKSGGTWRMLFHQETAATPPTAAAAAK
jgi:hypothetical protein